MVSTSASLLTYDLHSLTQTSLQWICRTLPYNQTGGGWAKKCNGDSREDKCHRRNDWKHCLAGKSKLLPVNGFEQFVDAKYCPPLTCNVQGAAEKEHSSSLAIAFLLFTLILTIFMIHAMLQVWAHAIELWWSNVNNPVSFWSQIKFHYLPESLAIVFLGAVLGLLMTALPEAETKRVRLIISLFHCADVCSFGESTLAVNSSRLISGGSLFPHNVLPHPPAPHHLWVWLQSSQGQFFPGQQHYDSHHFGDFQPWFTFFH